MQCLYMYGTLTGCPLFRGVCQWEVSISTEVDQYSILGHRSANGISRSFLV